MLVFENLAEEITLLEKWASLLVPPPSRHFIEANLAQLRAMFPSTLT